MRTVTGKPHKVQCQWRTECGVPSELQWWRDKGERAAASASAHNAAAHRGHRGTGRETQRHAERDTVTQRAVAAPLAVRTGSPRFLV